MNAIENFYFKIHLQYVIITYLGKKLFLELFMKEVLHCHLRASSPCTWKFNQLSSAAFSIFIHKSLLQIFSQLCTFTEVLKKSNTIILGTLGIKSTLYILWLSLEKWIRKLDSIALMENKYTYTHTTVAMLYLYLLLSK